MQKGQLKPVIETANSSSQMYWQRIKNAPSMYLSSRWEVLMNSLKRAELCPSTISAVVVPLKICFNVRNCRMPALPLKPLSGSNHFSTYIPSPPSSLFSCYFFF